MSLFAVLNNFIKNLMTTKSSLICSCVVAAMNTVKISSHRGR